MIDAEVNEAQLDRQDESGMRAVQVATMVIEAARLKRQEEKSKKNKGRNTNKRRREEDDEGRGSNLRAFAR